MRKLILFLLFTAIVAILAFPGMALTSAKDGLVLWATSLVPTLFPFMVITSLIVQYSGARGKSVFGQCVFAGIVSGYPVGAASAYLLKQQGADEEQVSTLAAFASFCSPGFMLSTIGTGLFGDSRMVWQWQLLTMRLGWLCGLHINLPADCGLEKLLRSKKNGR